MNIRFATFLVLLLVVATPTAAAHARFVESTPAPSARLAMAPTQVTVTLSQDIDPTGSHLRVFDTNGSRVDNDDFVVESGAQPVLTVTLRNGTGEGAYRVEWKAFSRVDHHTTQETFGFAVGNFTPPETIATKGDAATAASITGRFLFFIGLFLAVGALFFWLLARNDLTMFLREVDLLAWPLLVAGSAVLLGDAVSRVEASPSRWLESDVLRELVSRLGVAIVACALVVALPLAAGNRRGISALALVGLAVFSSRSGHASSHGWVWIGVDTVHLLSTATWVGGLLLFGFVLVAGRRTLADESLPRLGVLFSRAALVAVIVMASTGVLLGIRILGWPEPARPFEWFTGVYGTALLTKIGLALVMIGLATVNRFVFLRRLADDALRNGVRPRFARFVSGEAAIGVVVLFAAALLTSSSPSYESSAALSAETTGESDTFRVTMRIAPPPTPGAFSDLEFQIVWLEDGSIVSNDTCGRPSGCILLEFVPPGTEEHDEDETDEHHGGEHRILEPRADGWWVVTDVLFVDEGEYEFLVEIQTTDVFFDVVELHHHVGHEGQIDEHAGHTGAAS